MIGHWDQLITRQEDRKMRVMMGELHLIKCCDSKTMDSFKVDFLVCQDEACNI